ncbi:MAG: outer membrane protein assembly factor BamD [Proteobacteria bacterium]|nr:outer membrane protein assembly factor BamD [Pseudomonadota bacterium]
MAHPGAPKVNLGFLTLLFVGGAALLTVSGCATSQQCRENPARISLEKKIFTLEDQIEVQKKKILSLQGELTKRKPDLALEDSMGETLADSSFESMNTYYEAISLRDAGKYDEAVEKLNRFILENPDHVYSDRAQFLILDSHFKNREYGLALVDSFLLENRYSESRKIPEAVHKRALAYLNLGDKEKGAQTLKMLLESFPSSAVIPSAKETLASLQPSETHP